MELKEYLDKKYSKEEQLELTWLDCSNNNLTSLKGIEKLTNLTGLDCSNNNLTSLKGIENLTKLEWLKCDIKYENIEKEQKRLKIIRRKEIIKNILV